MWIFVKLLWAECKNVLTTEEEERGPVSPPRCVTEPLSEDRWVCNITSSFLGRCSLIDQQLWSITSVLISTHLPPPCRSPAAPPAAGGAAARGRRRPGRGPRGPAEPPLLRTYRSPITDVSWARSPPAARASLEPKSSRKRKKSSKCPRWRPEGVTAPSAAPSSQPALCSHPAPPHSSIPSSSLLQRRAAGRGCLRGRLRSSERRLGERTGVGGTAGGGGPEPQTHSHTPSRSYSHTDTADTHSRSSHQRSQCFQSAAPAHTRTKSWEQKLLQLSASTSGWDHAHTPAAAVWVAEGACHSKGGGAQRRQSVKECGENVSAHVCFWSLETKSTKNFKFLKNAGTDLYARQCARFVALSAKCVVSVLFCVVCCVVTVLFRVTMRVIMNVTKQCKLSPGRNPDCCQGLSPWCSPVSCFYRHT